MSLVEAVTGAVNAQEYVAINQTGEETGISNRLPTARNLLECCVVFKIAHQRLDDCGLFLIGNQKHGAPDR